MGHLWVAFWSSLCSPVFAWHSCDAESCTPLTLWALAPLLLFNNTPMLFDQCINFRHTYGAFGLLAILHASSCRRLFMHPNLAMIHYHNTILCIGDIVWSSLHKCTSVFMHASSCYRPCMHPNLAMIHYHNTILCIGDFV